MKLLFDQNLSRHLDKRLHDFFPDSAHVIQLHLDDAKDEIIWKFALENNYTIVTQDTDFYEMAMLYGYPPQSNNIVLRQYFHKKRFENLLG